MKSFFSYIIVRDSFRTISLSYCCSWTGFRCSSFNHIPSAFVIFPLWQTSFQNRTVRNGLQKWFLRWTGCGILVVVCSAERFCSVSSKKTLSSNGRTFSHNCDYRNISRHWSKSIPLVPLRACSSLVAKREENTIVNTIALPVYIFRRRLFLFTSAVLSCFC